MIYEAAAARYAQAAFSLAVESGDIPRWRAELEEIASVLSDSAAASVLADSRIPLPQRLAVVERTLGVSPFALNLAKLLVTKDRSLAARQVSDVFNRMADEHEGIARAQVTTAVELGAAELANIERKLSESTGKGVRTEAGVDPAIVGGIVIRIGDRLLDGSVRTRLKLLRRQLEGAH